MAYVTQSLPERIASKIDDSGDCWQWTAFVQGNGYGKVYHRNRVALAHRAVYELLVGDIPDGLVLDHLCRNRSCVNPHHLRAVTQRENTLAPHSESPSAMNAAKTVCPLGHPLDIVQSGARLCRTCRIGRDRRRWPDRSAIRSAKAGQRWELPADARARLRSDVIGAFGEDDRLVTADLTDRLMKLDEWSVRLSAMTQRSRSIWLGRVLGTSARTHKFGDRTNKGYRLRDLAA